MWSLNLQILNDFLVADKVVRLSLIDILNLEKKFMPKTKLHKVQLSPSTVEHILRRRGGKLHAYDSINPSKTALIVIDMQNVWLQEGMAAYSPYCAGAVPATNKLCKAMRAAGSKGYWVRAIYGDDAPKTWSAYM